MFTSLIFSQPLYKLYLHKSWRTSSLRRLKINSATFQTSSRMCRDRVSGHTSQPSEVSSGRDLHPRFSRRLSVGAWPAGRSSCRKSNPPLVAFSESMMLGWGREDGRDVLTGEDGSSRGQADSGRRQTGEDTASGDAEDGRGDGTDRAGDGDSDSRELKDQKNTCFLFASKTMKLLPKMLQWSITCVEER